MNRHEATNQVMKFKLNRIKYIIHNKRLNTIQSNTVLYCIFYTIQNSPIQYNTVTLLITYRAVPLWNTLQDRVVKAPNLNSFKARLEILNRERKLL